jgi:1,4-dihydroxy-2-naphthoyl-CoA hydrolase
MAIWTRDISLEAVNERCQGSLIGHVGIEVIEIGEDYLKARMPVDQRTKQPAGVLHGGASVVLAETLASWAATFSVDSTKHHCVGLEINANHVRAASSGFVYGTAGPSRALHPYLGGPGHERGRQARLHLARDHGGARRAEPLRRQLTGRLPAAA